LENNTGCAGNLVVFISALILGFLSFFSTNSISVPLRETGYLFVLDDEGVNYSFRETLNCEYVIAGNVVFLNNNGVIPDNIVIMVQPLNTYDDRPPAVVSLGDYVEYGENGWSQLLFGNYSYYVWVHDLTLDVPLSEKILVDEVDCANNRTLALVNFRQVLPFS
jgi:hypothetical protein